MVRKNLKVPEDLFLAMRDDKDDQQSWPHYLEEQCLHSGGGVDTERIESSLATIEERTGKLERMVEGLRK